MSAIPGAGDAIGLAAKGITGCTKASKAIKYATRLAGKAGNCALSAYSTSKQIWGMWDKYVFKGESWGNESWGELLGVTVSSVSTASSAKGIVADLRNYSYVKHDILTSQCFVEGTLIVTDEGDKPIEEIKAGDFVYSTNPETGESEYKEVLRTFRKESDVLIHIFVNGEEIETTPVHPFWVVDQWVSAKDLETGDILTLADGTTAPVTDTYGEKLAEPVIVYNFEVSDFHTYYVTDTGVLVHNANKNPFDTCSVSANGAKTSPKKEESKTRVRHYTNSQGLTGIKESGVIRAKDNNRVYVELASKKPLSNKKAESFYQLKTGRGKHYIEFDVSSSKLEWVNNPRYHRDELTVKGDVLIENAQFFRRKE